MTEHAFEVAAFVKSIVDGFAIGLAVIIAGLGLLALIRHGSLKSPWAQRTFLDPIDRARERKAAAEALAADAHETPEIPRIDQSEAPDPQPRDAARRTEK
jgi:hypothetical protein